MSLYEMQSWGIDPKDETRMVRTGTVSFSAKGYGASLRETNVYGPNRLTRSDAWYRREDAEKKRDARKKYMVQLKKLKRQEWSRDWSNYESQAAKINLSLSKQEAIARAKYPKVRLQRRQMLRGQKGYIPLAKRRPLHRQAIRQREKAFRPFNTARAEVSKFGRNLMKQKPK